VSDRDELVAFQARLADLLLGGDDLEAALADLATDIEPHVDGVRLSALLVARLRFERLLHGSARAGEWFKRDSASFAEAFRRYHAAVPPTAADPPGEAALFDAWAGSSESDD